MGRKGKEREGGRDRDEKEERRTVTQSWLSPLVPVLGKPGRSV